VRASRVRFLPRIGFRRAIRELIDFAIDNFLLLNTNYDQSVGWNVKPLKIASNVLHIFHQGKKEQLPTRSHFRSSGAFDLRVYQWRDVKLIHSSRRSQSYASSIGKKRKRRKFTRIYPLYLSASFSLTTKHILILRCVIIKWSMGIYRRYQSLIFLARLVNHISHRIEFARAWSLIVIIQARMSAARDTRNIFVDF